MVHDRTLGSGQYRHDVGVNDLAIVRAVIGLAEAFDLQLVAEGVETPSAAKTLMQHGCHRAQGYLFSRPIPGDAMESLLASRWISMPFLANEEALAEVRLGLAGLAPKHCTLRMSAPRR